MSSAPRSRSDSTDRGTPERYDLVITGGLVIDPAQRIHARKHVAIRDGKIAALQDRIDPSMALRVIDVDGRIVCPGLIDLHTHLYHKVSKIGLDVDAACLAEGVTTSVDAGSAGSTTFAGFRDYCVRRAKSRVYAFVNLASIGLIDAGVGELRDMIYADAEGAAATVEENRDICLGIKIRMGEQFVNGAGLRPLALCIEAAENVGCSVMVHITQPAAPLSDMFDLLRPGDVITHVFHGRGETIVQDGRVLDALERACKRGVRTDLGHGGGSFAFSIARAALATGFRPDSISTDLHTGCVNGPCYSLTTTMAKFLALGLSIDEVIEATTIEPARTIHKEHMIGSLTPGHVADVTVLDLLDKISEFEDCEHQIVRGEHGLRAAMAISGGEVVASRLEHVPAAPAEERLR